MTTLETRVVNPVATATTVKSVDVSSSEMVDAALAREEEEIVDEEIPSDEEEEELEQAMVQAALAKSVEEAVGSPGSRYGLRKRRRPGDLPATNLMDQGPAGAKGATKSVAAPTGILKKPRIEGAGPSSNLRSPRSPRGKVTTKVELPPPGRATGSRRHAAVPTPIAPNVRSSALATGVIKKAGGRSVSIKLPLIPAKSSGHRPVANPILPVSTPSTTLLKSAKPPAQQKKAIPATKTKLNTPTRKKPQTPIVKEELVPTSGAVPNPLQLATSTIVRPAPPAPPTSKLVVPDAPKSIASSVPAPVPCPLHLSSSQKAPAPATTAAAPTAPENDVEPTGRSRVFSVDLDPSTFDFTDIGASLDEKPGPPEPTGDGVDLPLVQRERAFSFEFFNFSGGDELLPASSVQVNLTDTELPNPADMPEPASIHRPRGDSIIFDPVSFQDGGIHEKNALLKVKSEPQPVVPSSSSVVAPKTRVDHRSSQATMLVKSMDTPNPLPPYSSIVRPEQALSRSSVPAPAMGLPKTASSPQVATLPSALSASLPNNDSDGPATFQMELLNKDGRIGIYLPEARKARIARFHAKRKMRIWRKRIKYDCRKKLADSRPRIKGRFVKRSDMEDD